ncbi:MAG: hypothetical protein JNL81_08660 [Hyphomonadaceae bacterium]|nr:hypothetical protein [Hyphomonadaceae bacterium]
MVRMFGALVLLLALGACAAFSTAPEAANVRVRELCGVLREPAWVQIPEPDNAQAYRDAWTSSAAGQPFRRAYVVPRRPEAEFWFRDASGTTKLCTGRPFAREERCGAGTTLDFTEDANGIVASNFEEPVCVL